MSFLAAAVSVMMTRNGSARIATMPSAGQGTNEGNKGRKGNSRL
jgi:hypothetical protein